MSDNLINICSAPAQAYYDMWRRNGEKTALITLLAVAIIVGLVCFIAYGPGMETIRRSFKEERRMSLFLSCAFVGISYIGLGLYLSSSNVRPPVPILPGAVVVDSPPPAAVVVPVIMPGARELPAPLPGGDGGGVPLVEASLSVLQNQEHVIRTGNLGSTSRLSFVRTNNGSILQYSAKSLVHMLHFSRRRSDMPNDLTLEEYSLLLHTLLDSKPLKREWPVIFPDKLNCLDKFIEYRFHEFIPQAMRDELLLANISRGPQCVLKILELDISIEGREKAFIAWLRSSSDLEKDYEMEVCNSLLPFPISDRGLESALSIHSRFNSKITILGDLLQKHIQIREGAFTTINTQLVFLGDCNSIIFEYYAFYPGYSYIDNGITEAIFYQSESLLRPCLQEHDRVAPEYRLDVDQIILALEWNNSSFSYAVSDLIVQYLVPDSRLSFINQLTRVPTLSGVYLPTIAWEPGLNHFYTPLVYLFLGIPDNFVKEIRETYCCVSLTSCFWSDKEREMLRQMGHCAADWEPLLLINLERTVILIALRDSVNLSANEKNRLLEEYNRAITNCGRKTVNGYDIAPITIEEVNEEKSALTDKFLTF